jgi:hypothetical protein
MYISTFFLGGNTSQETQKMSVRFQQNDVPSHQNTQLK